MKNIIEAIFRWHRYLVQPRSTQPDLARKEHIFYILLISGLYLTGVAALLVSGSFISHYLNQQTFHGIFPVLIITISLSLVSLYQISRQGKPKLAASIYLSILWLTTAYTSLRWGALLYQAVLMYSVIIVFSGILASTQLAFATTFITSVTVILLTYLQKNNLIYVDQLWRQTPPHLGNALVVSFTFIILAIFSWLSNKEIYYALKRAQKSEKALEKERDSLEVEIEKRTQQLQQAQLEKMIQWQRFVDMGKIASGLFHDLSNYLTSVALDLELDENQRALATMNQIKIFMHNTQKQLTNKNQLEWFSPITEINESLSVLKYLANKNKIKFVFNHPKSTKEVQQLYGPISIFHQIIINLLSNAIDAYSDVMLPHSSQNRQIEISLVDHHLHSIIEIKDSGCGINLTQQIQIFEPFFTTKNNQNNFGLGLFLTKSAIEDHFNGKISLISKPDLGSTFSVTFPHQKNLINT